jgi:hypothetical protein
LPPIDELGSQYLAVMKVLAVLVDLLVHGREAVALADVEHEVDIPGEDIGELQRHVVRDIGRFGGLKQRRSMVAAAVRIRVCTGLSMILAAKPCIPAHHLQVLSFADLAREFLAPPRRRA